MHSFFRFGAGVRKKQNETKKPMGFGCHWHWFMDYINLVHLVMTTMTKETYYHILFNSTLTHLSF